MEKKKSNKGLIGLIVFLIIIVLGLGGYVVYDIMLNTKKTFTSVDNNTIVEILQDKKIINKNIKLIDTVEEIDSGVIPHNYKYYIYEENNGSIFAIYYKSNTITKDNFTVKIYNNLYIDENVEYIYGDTSKYSLIYKYRNGSFSKTNKYFERYNNNYETYNIIKTKKGYSINQEK